MTTFLVLLLLLGFDFLKRTLASLYQRLAGIPFLYFGLVKLVVVLAALLWLPPTPSPVQAAVVAGFSEFYLAGSTDQLFALLRDNDNSPDMGNATVLGLTKGTCNTGACNRMHSVATVVIATDNTKVYYDHWENGYGTGATGNDEVYIGNAGDVLVFESFDIVVPRTAAATCASTNPGGASPACYDGRDRIYAAGGAIGVAQAFWPERNGTVYANAWEVYPVKPYQSTYVLPVGEDLFAAPRNYADFKHVYVLAQATEDGTVVTIDDPLVPGVQVNVPLNRGETTQYFHANTGTSITGSKPIQVQFIAGQDWSSDPSDTRSYTAVPGSLWDSAYYAPVPSANATTEVDIYIYNPTPSNLVINYEDRLGTGTITIPPNSTRSYSELVGREVPTTSAVALAAADGTTKFWAIGSNDTENADYNHGFSLIPASTLTDNYYIGWSPGTTDLSNNGSPVFVTATQDNTTIFVDYSPTNGVVDATYTLDRIQVQKIFDPDNNNTGMHIWATAPIALVWGEDATVSPVGNPYIDAGYAILPLKPEWVDIVVTLDKSANPSSISPVAGQVSEFTLSFNATAYGLNDVYVTDVLPANWAYIPGTTLITWPGGSSTADPTGGTGPNLAWGSAAVPLADLQPNETLTLVYQAQTTGVPSNYSLNTATGTGTYNGETFSASDTTTVVATPPDLTVTKTNDVVGNALVGHPFIWTLEVLNGSGSGLATFASGQAILRDNLPAGPTYGAVTVTNGTPGPGGTGSISCSIAANTLTCTASGGTVTLPTGASFQVAFSVTPASAGTLVNPPAGGGSVCQVDPDGVVAESDETNNTASDTVTVVAPTLAITKISSAGGTVAPGDTIAYTLSIANTGSSQQNNIVVMDTLPAGTTYVAQSTSVTGVTLLGTVGDAFNANGAFTGNQDSNGGGADPTWIGNWIEVGEGDGAGAGDVRVTGNELRIQDNDSGGEGVRRDVDLSSCNAATLSLAYRRIDLDDANDYVRLSIGTSGTLTDILTDFGGPANDGTNQSYSVDISNWISNQTRLQLLSSAAMDDSDQVFFDNILITCYDPITKDNIPGGVNTDLTSGIPSTLVAAVDNFDLPVGSAMTVTYQVTVNDPIPAGQTQVVNTAQASSDEQPQPVSATVTDTIGAPALATIGDQVWNDTNGNGVQDGGETGISGVTVTLYLGATPVQTVTTNASGLYTFTNVVSGTYSVQFSQPSGYTFTGQDQGGDDNLDSDADPSGQTAAFVVNAGDVITNIDAGLYEPASISGQVREDTDGDGNLADPDSGIAGATVVLYTDPNGDGDPADGVPVLTTTTTITGGYLFTDVTPGSYVVVETDPSGYSSTADTDAPNDNQISVTLTGGTNSTGNDFLDTQPATVSGQVREDTDGDGNLADPDSGITGVTVVLYTDPNGDGDPADGVPVLTTTTTITGGYVFTNVTPGSYIVVETDPSGYSSTADTDAPNDNQIEVTLTSGQTSSNNDFLDSQPATISGQVREDTDGDGDLTDLDSGITSVTVVLYTDPDGDGDPADGVPVLTTTTTITGGYVFTNVTPGNYVVVETDPNGYSSTADTDAPNDNQVSVTLTSGTDSIGNDFLDTQPATVSGQVREDTDGDGNLADPDSGITGVTVVLYTDPNGDGDPADGVPVLTTTTTITGGYVFTNVTPGSYVVVETDPSGYSSTADTDVPNDNQVSVTLTGGVDSTGNDFLDTQPASISGQVREDTDGDGDLADPDSGITSVTVVLYTDPNGDGDPTDGVPVLTTTTTITGGYIFTNVTPGNYVVVETDLNGYNSTADTDAPNDNQVGVTLVSGTHSTGNDFLDTQPATLSGQVREDTDGDGNLADPDSGITGVTVVLYTDPNGDGDPADGVPVLTTTTTITGGYVFTNITPGNYVVVETDPNGYSSTADTDAPNDNQIEVTLTSGQTSSNNDFLDSQPADVTLIKHDSPDPVVAGGVLTYTLVYTNNGPASADNVLITDTLPAQVTFGGVVSQPGTVSGPAGAGQTRVWTVGKVAPGASGTIVFTVTVNSNTSVAITNNAVISTTTPDNNPSNNSDNEPTTVINPSLAIAKTPDNQQVASGGTVTFTIRVTNTGNVTLTNVTVSDPQAPACTTTLGVLAPRSSAGYTCTLSNVTVDFTNVATATGTPPVGSNVSDNDDANVDVISNPGLEVEKSVDLAEVAPNQVVTYTITITNTGNVLIRPVRMTDTLPPGFSYVPGSGSPLPNSISGGRLIWNDVTGGAGLTPGQTLRVTFRAIMPATPSTYINTAVVAGTHPTGVITDTDTAPVVVADPTVEIVKTALAPGVVDGLITFTIRITNTGPSTLDEVPLVDHFTGPVVYVGGTPPANTVDNVHQVIGWNDLTANTPNGFGRDLAPQESFVITTVFSLTTGATTFTMTNVATVNNAIDIFNNPVNEDADAEVITNEPTAIQLLYFKGERQGSSVSLTWATAVELDNFGFRILRSASGSLADAVDLAFIPGRGHGTASGASYSFSDKTVEANQTYTYWLVDVDFNGLETFHGPATVSNPGIDQGTSSTIFLPVIVQ